MFVRVHLLGVLATALLVSAPAAAQTPANRCGPSGIGLFSSAVLLDSIPGRGDAERDYKERQLFGRRQLAIAADSLKYIVDQFARSESQFTAVQREAAIHLLRARELQFEDFAQQVQVADDQWRAELQAPLRARVMAAAEEMRMRGKCTMLLDRSALGSAVVAGPTAIDLTAAILAELRRVAAAQ